MKTLENKKQRHEELAKGKTLIKCDYQKAYEYVKEGDVKQIKGLFFHLFEDYKLSTHSGKLLVNELGGLFLDTIKENSNDFTKDIAEKTIEKQFELSEKQEWCLAYQVVNNKEVYLKAIIEEWDKSTANAEVDEIMSKEDNELSRLGFEIFKEENL